VRRQDVPAEIAWRCPGCGEEGVISNWPGTPWDLSPSRMSRPDDRAILLTESEYQTLRNVQILDRDAQRLVAGAWLNEVRVHLVADPDELEHLIGFVAADANHEPDRRRAGRLDDLFGLLESHLSIARRIEQSRS
jgi:hypothetical protein